MTILLVILSTILFFLAFYIGDKNYDEWWSIPTMFIILACSVSIFVSSVF